VIKGALRPKLADTRKEVRNLTVMGMRSGLAPKKAKLIRNLERSAKAEVRPRQKHLEYVLKMQAKGGE
jgi:hypothetical protein